LLDTHLVYGEHCAAPQTAPPASSFPLSNHPQPDLSMALQSWNTALTCSQNNLRNITKPNTTQVYVPSKRHHQHGIFFRFPTKLSFRYPSRTQTAPFAISPDYSTPFGTTLRRPDVQASTLVRCTYLIVTSILCGSVSVCMEMGSCTERLRKSLRGNG
jgi:hypothetical protein